MLKRFSYLLPAMLLMVVAHLLFGFLGTTAVIILCCIWLIVRIHIDTGSFLNNITGVYALSVLITTAANVEVWSLFNQGIFLNSYRYARRELFPDAQLLWGIGNLAIFAGLATPGKSVLPPVRFTLPERYYRVVFGLSVLFAFKNFWMFFELPGALSSIVDLVPLLSILWFARLSYEREEPRLMRWAVILTAIKTLLALLFAYLRSEMVLPLVILGLGVYLGAGSFRPFLQAKAVPFYVFGIVFVAFFQIFGDNRSNLGLGFDRFTQIREVARVREEFVDRETQLSAFQRMSCVSQLSAVQGLVNDNGHYNGEVSAPLATALIPRFLWPEKPMIALGVWFAVMLGEAIETETWFNNSVNMTIPGQLYLDFGWLGVLLGGFLVGWIFSQWWKASLFIEEPGNFFGAVFGGYLLYNALLGLGADLQMVITALAFYLILLALSKVLTLVTQKNLVRRTPVAGK